MIELLAPARDLGCGRAAIAAGADAIYVGPPSFGARVAAGNSLEDIATLCAEAHLFGVRVYATLNTLLHDQELPQAVALVHQLWEVGVDALIIQDLGLLEQELPPIPLHASTQTHALRPDRMRFLAQLGFERVILARELSLEEIREIRSATPVELEVFVHGALCVSHSGQCWLSWHRGGRSANRGACAQPCRLPYTLLDSQGRALATERHLLSLKDLDRSASLGELVDAGVTSLKIEGRLKGPDYVSNVVAHHRGLLDQALAERGLDRASSGRSVPGFAPDPRKTFSREPTEYRLHGQVGALTTWPTATGEALGRWGSLEAEVRPGDGLVWEVEGQLQGAKVDAVQDGRVSLRGASPPLGARVWRNRDQAFLEALSSARPRRTLAVEVDVHEDRIEAREEDGMRASVPLLETEPARDPERARATLDRQLRKSGGTAFSVEEVRIHTDPPPFLPTSQLNALRRQLLDDLRSARLEAYPRPTTSRAPHPVAAPPDEPADYRLNVLNQAARDLYERCGMSVQEPAAESGQVDLSNRALMRTHHCIRRELGLCARFGGTNPVLPRTLVAPDGERYTLRFDCGRCEMEVLPA